MWMCEQGVRTVLTGKYILSFAFSLIPASNRDAGSKAAILGPQGWQEHAKDDWVERDKEAISPLASWSQCTHPGFLTSGLFTLREKRKPPICLSHCFQVCVFHSQTEFSTNIRHTLIEIQAKDLNRQFNKGKNAKMGKSVTKLTTSLLLYKYKHDTMFNCHIDNKENNS